MTDDNHRSTEPSPLPSSMLPNVNPDGAPEMLHLPPADRLPVIDSHEVSTLAPEDSHDIEPVPTNGDSLRIVLENVVSEALAKHEGNEQLVAQGIAERVERSERSAIEERKAMAEKIDRVTTVCDNIVELHRKLPELLLEVSANVADRFLEPVSRLLSQMELLTDKIAAHELQLRRLDRLKLDELRAQHDKLSETVAIVQTELAEIQRQLGGLIGDGR